MVRVGDCELKLDDAVRLAEAYARDRAATILFYDFAGDPDGEIRPAKGPISLADIGRMTIINADLTGADVGRLLTRTEVQWSSVAPAARLEDADPDDPDGLYAAMNIMWRNVRVKNSGIGPAKASKLLHLKRPFAFPLLDRDVRKTYEKRYREARDFWRLIREDLIAGAADLQQIREQLGAAGDADVVRASRLPMVRLLDIIAWQLQQS